MRKREFGCKSNLFSFKLFNLFGLLLSLNFVYFFRYLTRSYAIKSYPNENDQNVIVKKPSKTVKRLSYETEDRKPGFQLNIASPRKRKEIADKIDGALALVALSQSF